MIRVAAWSGALFIVACAVCELFPAPLVEPLALIAVGAALLLLAGRPEPRSAAAAQPRTPDGVSTAGGVPSTRPAR